MRYSFTLEARAQLRAIDGATALHIPESIDRFGSTGSGGVHPLHGEWTGCFRLRIGEYRVIFRYVVMAWKFSPSGLARKSIVNNAVAA